MVSLSLPLVNTIEALRDYENTSGAGTAVLDEDRTTNRELIAGSSVWSVKNNCIIDSEDTYMMQARENALDMEK